MTGQFRIELLSSEHNRASFSCGVDALEQASQDMRRRVASCYVAIENEQDSIVGYYTLAAAGVALSDLPDAITKKLPRYPSVPVAILGRLAVDVTFQGRKLGAALLGNAIQRSLRSEIAVSGVVVTAKDAQAEAFYRYHDFLNFGNNPRQLILSLSSYRPAVSP
jgi:predicted GNAT family N-acyltransferase